jgi:hypothetical protein
MPKWLTERNGVWQFVHRVPKQFARLDPRGVIKHSTRIEITKDPEGIRAGEIADEMKRDLEAYWQGLEEGKPQDARARYNESRRRARTYGFDYVNTPGLVSRKQLTAIDAWIAKQKEPGLTRREALRRLVEIGLKAKAK